MGPMRFNTSRLLSLPLAAIIGLAGCDDDGGTGPVVLNPPAGVTAVATGPTTVRVTWNQVANAEGYEVDRAPDQGAFATVETGLAATFFEDDGLVEGTAYRYRVRAVKGSVLSANSGEVEVLTGTGGPKLRVINGVTQNTTLRADSVYVLSGFVKVSNGATLTIEPGTRIVGDTLAPGSSLWVLRGSRLIAEGTAENPIVFTSQRAAGSRRPGDWGGIVIIGNAPINRTANPIFTEGPTGAAENYAGGTDFDDDSGSLKYVRIEFAGYDVSNGAGQELNGLSSYAVGRGTEYDYVQVMSGLDDSFEFWGGGVDVRHLVSYEAGDDHFDWSEGYRGRGQHLIALQTTVPTPRPGSGTVSSDPRGFEGDGCESDKAGCTYANQPTSQPVWANFTVVGPGAGIFSSTDGNGAVIRRGSGGTLVNGIIARWPGVGISIRDAESGALLADDSLTVRGIVLAGNGSNFEAAASGRFGHLVQQNATAWKVQEAAINTLFSTLPTSTSNPTTIDWAPAAGSAAATGGLGDFTGTSIAGRVQGFFGGAMPATAYAGAADPAAAEGWWEGWTVFIRD
ncbi:MAG TPA: fibronectin type III domain-containing protein [Longimicrobiaceae bacterium]